MTAGPVDGTVVAETSFVHIRWPWLAYLLVELTLSTGFLIAIIAWTFFTKTEMLGGSALATLCALDEPTRQSLGHVGEYNELRRRAARMHIKLVEGPEGLMLREFDKPRMKA